MTLSTSTPEPGPTPAVNPLLAPWETPFGLPPFEAIRAEHFAPALREAMAQHRAELDAIAADARPADFDNTVAAFDRSARLLGRIEAVFYNLSASATSPELQAVQREARAPGSRPKRGRVTRR